MMRKIKTKVVILGISLFGLAFMFNGCTKYASPEDLQALEQQRQAALAAEAKVQELERQKADLERQIAQKERELETAYNDSKLPYSPNEDAIKQLLLDCLEDYYSTLDGCIDNPDKYKVALEQITAICNSIGG